MNAIETKIHNQRKEITGLQRCILRQKRKQNELLKQIQDRDELIMDYEFEINRLCNIIDTQLEKKIEQ